MVRMKIIIITVGLIAIIMSFGTGIYARSGFGASLHLGYYIPAGWADTYDLVYGGSGEPAYGIELKYLFDMPLELAFTLDMISGSGEAVWPDGESSGESISFDLMPLMMYARWRFNPDAKLSPYLGLGGGFVTFKESGRGSKSGGGFGLQGGLDYSFLENLNGYAEIEYTSFPDVIGGGDASLYYGEDDVGGITIRMGIRYLF